jgi:hypothetical protein
LAVTTLAGLTVGFLAGMVTDRIRYEHQRSSVLARYEQARQRWQEQLMALETRAAR